jgi:hypothetical protein
MRISASDYHAGMRVVAGRGMRRDLRGARTWEEMRIETVVHIDGDVGRGNVRMTLAHAEGTRDVLLCHTSVLDDAFGDDVWRTLWSEPLPVDDAVSLAYVASVLSRDVAATALFWMGVAVDERTAYAHLVTDDHSEYAEGQGRHGSMYRAVRSVVVRGSTPVVAGALVAARLGEATQEDGVTIHAIHDETTLLERVTLDEAAAAIPVRIGTFEHSGRNLAGWHEMSRNEALAQAHGEASEALVLRWRDGERLRGTCLATTGVAFWNVDEPELHAAGPVPGPGLWMWSDVTTRGGCDHEGLYDFDLRGTWTPASLHDVVRMAGGLRAVRDDIRDHADEAGLEDPVDHYIGLATGRIVDAAERPLETV